MQHNSQFLLDSICNTFQTFSTICPPYTVFNLCACKQKYVIFQVQSLFVYHAALYNIYVCVEFHFLDTTSYLTKIWKWNHESWSITTSSICYDDYISILCCMCRYIFFTSTVYKFITYIFKTCEIVFCFINVLSKTRYVWYLTQR